MIIILKITEAMCITFLGHAVEIRHPDVIYLNLWCFHCDWSLFVHVSHTLPIIIKDLEYVIFANVWGNTTP